MMKKYFIVLSVLLGFSNSAFSADIKICTDQNFWYPFTFVTKGASDGLHVSVAKRALQDSGHNVQFIPMDWKKCLSAAKKGKVDAVISASYKDKRAKFLHYPADAKTSKKSASRITQVEYVVVSMTDEPYEFNGDVKTLPSPVRAPKSYSIVDDLKKEGVKVKTGKGDIFNLNRLVKSKKGVVITLPEIAKRLGSAKKFAGKLRVHAKPIKSKSYYMAISKKSALTQTEREDIWSNIAKTRDNEVLMSEFLGKL